MNTKYNVDTARVLDGYAIQTPDLVTYKRANGETVRGFVERVSTGNTAVYIFDAKTARIVAAPIARVTLA